MTKRLYLRAGEVPTLFGQNASQSEWGLYEQLRSGEDNGAGDYGRWQGRLMHTIMHGVCEDHSLKNGRELQPTACPYNGIMPSRAWEIEPKMETGGRPSILVVTQRTGVSMREWKQPDTMSMRSRIKYEALATAYDVEDVLIGVLVDGYSSQLFHITVPIERRIEIRRVCDLFLADVRDGNEPEIDFAADEGSIRKGVAITKVEASAEIVEALVKEHRVLANERVPADAALRRIETRMREIDTALIHLAGATMKVETPQHIITIKRDAKNVARVDIVDKAPTPLF